MAKNELETETKERKRNRAISETIYKVARLDFDLEDAKILGLNPNTFTANEINVLIRSKLKLPEKSGRFSSKNLIADELGISKEDLTTAKLLEAIKKLKSRK